MRSAVEFWSHSGVAFDVALATRDGEVGLDARRTRRLAELLYTAARRSPVYRKLLAGRPPGEVRLADLPVTHKHELMARFADWVTDPALRLDALRHFVADPARVGELFLGQYVVWESSGSTGEPALFVQDRLAMTVYDALEGWRRPVFNPWRRVFDPWGFGDRLVFVGATGGHFASNVSLERLLRLNPALSRRMSTVSFLQPVAQIDDALNRAAPTLLATYPSAAVLLAGEQVAGRLSIAPSEIWTGGETLSASARKVIEQAFACPVVNSYGSSEFLATACECGSGALHLNSDWCILEPVDASGRPVEPDTLGATVLLTNLANHVQPIIRYDLGDRVALHSARCACGSSLPVMDVQGRCDDSLSLRGDGAVDVHVLPLALCTVMEEDASLFDFQIVQDGARELSLTTARHGVAATESLRRGASALRRYLASQGAAGVRIHCRSGAPNRLGRSGKLQRIVAAPKGSAPQ